MDVESSQPSDEVEMVPEKEEEEKEEEALPLDDEGEAVDAAAAAKSDGVDTEDTGNGDKDSHASSSSTGYPEEDLECEYNDELQDMTYGRWIARHLAKHNWYYPYAKTRQAYEEAAAKQKEQEKEQEQNDESAGEAENTTTQNDESGGEAPDQKETNTSSLKPPSLDAAWAYFEHVVLPRYFVNAASDETKTDDGGEDGTSKRQQRRSSSWIPGLGGGSDKFVRAEPGETEKETRLYPIWSTPEVQLADFGIGVGVYFHTLKLLILILIIAGLINIPVIMYYRSTDYSPDAQEPVKGILKGSAICSDTKWMACPTCTPQQWDSTPKTEDRYASLVDENGDTLSFILNNNCQVESNPAIANWVSLLFCIVAFYLLSVVSRKKEVKFDEAQQTTTDYSVEVVHPPKQARDPEIWKQFFSQFDDGHVTAITVALDNEELVRALASRRQLLGQLHMMMPTGTKFKSFDDKDFLTDLKDKVDTMPRNGCVWRLYMMIMYLAFRPQQLYKKIVARTDTIHTLSQQTYDVSHVFCTFETEQAQRRALEALSVKKMDIWKNNVEALDENLRFRMEGENGTMEEYVLNVREPVEPDAVRWQDLDETLKQRIIQRTITFILTAICVVGGGVLIALARGYSPGLGAMVIVVLNTATPLIVKQIIKFESHASEGSKQTSLYVKMTAIRWVNTAIITTVVEPFTNTVANGDEFLLQSVYAIFFAELVQTPILMGTDYMGNLKRHIFGPRIKDQRMMIDLGGFMGGYYTLAERYTDMTKVLFLCFFYCLLFPGGFFFAAGALFMHYWTSKYCLLRTWQRAPQLGTHLGYFSRRFFFPLTILAFGIMAAYNYGSFPFDNSCDSGEPVPDNYIVQDATAVTLAGKEVSVTITPQDTEHYYCWQDLIRFGVFPPTDRKVDGEEWMTEGQERWTTIYGWTALAVLIWVLVVYFNRFVVTFLKRAFTKTYKPSGKAMDMPFSKVQEIFGYVPQVKVYGSRFPGIVCDIDAIDQDMIGWRDAYHSYDVHNLILDVPSVREKVMARRARVKESGGDPGEMGEEDRKAAVFSMVKHWPPAEGTETS